MRMRPCEDASGPISRQTVDEYRACVDRPGCETDMACTNECAAILNRCLNDHTEDDESDVMLNLCQRRDSLLRRKNTHCCVSNGERPTNDDVCISYSRDARSSVNIPC